MKAQSVSNRMLRQHSVRWWLGLLLVPCVMACDNLLTVSNPGSVEATDLENPALAPTMLASALGRFECAYVNHILGAAMLSREFINSSNWAPINPFARRTEGLETSTGSCPDDRTSNAMGSYAPLQQARYLAENGARLIEGFPDAEVPNKTNVLAQLAAYAGYATQILGEGWCVMSFDLGPALTRKEVFERAEERFTTAIDLAQSAGNANLRLMALLGRARSRLNQGKLAEAATDADQIPEGFVWNATYSSITGQRENRIYNFHNLLKFVSSNFFEYRDLTIDGVPDTRVPIRDTGGLGQSGGVPMWAQEKYFAVTTPIPIASWREAQLIIAEARPAEAAAAINRLRSSQGLPAYTPSGNGVLADVLEERRRQLFLEGGHRYNDMLRHNLPFPIGRDHQDIQYGDITCLPLPRAEWENNPNIPSNPNPPRS
jgi:hypothetical protein